MHVKSTTGLNFRKNYDLDKDGRDWKIITAKNDLINNKSVLTKVNYRPFDYRLTFYTGKSKGFHSYPRHNIHKHLINKKNFSLVLGRQGQAVGSMQWNLIFINNCVLDSNMFYRGGNMAYPIYLYTEDEGQFQMGSIDVRTPNFNKEILNQIVEKLGLSFVAEREEGNVCFANNNDELRDEFKSVFAPIDLLDYIYAVLHSPAYREKYKEFLKIDFPRVPYPEDAGKFWQLVKLGGEIRQLHLLESAAVNKFITKYPVAGSNVVGKPVYKEGKVYINDTQYFENVPPIAWEFYIGGYQPAQKWLKDRKDRELSFEDIQHYQKIIVALTETDRLMKEIDLVGVV